MKKKAIYIFIGLAIIMIGGYLLFKGNPIKSVYPLKKGDQGNEVAELQRLLGIADDGIFGAGTEKAVLDKFGKTTVTKSDIKTLM